MANAKESMEHNLMAMDINFWSRIKFCKSYLKY
jgi:hypothetical protein